MTRVDIVERDGVVIYQANFDGNKTCKPGQTTPHSNQQLPEPVLSHVRTNHRRHQSSDHHRPIIRRASLAYVRQKIWPQPLDQDTRTGGHPDRIFALHERNVRGELRRRCYVHRGKTGFGGGKEGLAVQDPGVLPDTIGGAED